MNPFDSGTAYNSIMPKLLYICTRDQEIDQKKIKKLADELKNSLIPDLLRPVRSDFHLGNKEAFIIINSNSNTFYKEFSLCQGKILGPPEELIINKQNIPEGSFVLFRNHGESVEITTDATASYTLWYYMDDQCFLASTSQRAIIHYLKSFEFNQKVIPWMLSAGILGPGLAWDKRLQLIPGHTSLLLDKRKWRLTQKMHEFEISVVREMHANDFIREALNKVFDKLDLDFEKWVLPLSGGCDSRLLLSLLHKNKGIRTVTWGTKQALINKSSDAYIAREVARHYQVPHKYCLLDENGLAPADILDRILVAGEGRTDTIIGYADGFQMWKELFDDNIEGIIRGDHGFGTRSATRQVEDGMRWAPFNLLSDYDEYDQIKEFMMPDQQFPVSFNRKESEMLFQWEIRLRQTFSIPYWLSGLNDMKTSFMDVYNPLLSRSIIEAILSCPKQADKRFIKRLNKQNGPEIPYATQHSTPGLKQLFSERGFYSYLVDYFTGKDDQLIVHPGLVGFVLNGMAQPEGGSQIKSLKKRLKNAFKFRLPNWLMNELTMRYRNNKLNYYSTAIRLYIILRMNEILQQDAKPEKP